MSSTTYHSRQVLVSQRPTGRSATLQDFDSTSAVDFNMPDDLPEGHVFLKTLWLSVDPYMRPKLTATDSYTAPYELNKPMSGMGVAEVVHSKHETLKEGQLVVGGLQWMEYQCHSGQSLFPIPASADTKNLSHFLGTLSIVNGGSAYFGLNNVGNMKEGEVVVISSAAGAVGNVACQLAKIQGAFVVGIAGGEEKKKFLLEELGVDGVVDYQEVFAKYAESSYKERINAVGEAIKEATQGKSVDVYFDNVGGEILDGVLGQMSRGGRLTCCGAISLYNRSGDEPIKMENYFRVLSHSLTIRGWLCMQFVADWPKALGELQQHIGSGKLKVFETREEGFDRLVPAFLGLFEGRNTGKQVVHIADPTV